MNKFKLTVTMDENKNLTLTETVNQNQGENNCSALDIFVPKILAVDRVFFVEFLCPKNKRFVSPPLSEVETAADYANFVCDIPSCVLQEEGYVQIQLVSCNKTTGEEIYKSNFSAKVSFFVHASVNASQTYSAGDYFTQMYFALKTEREETSRLSESLATCQQKVTELETLLKNHTENVKNPHAVTKAQVGLDKVDNIADNVKCVARATIATTDNMGNFITRTYATKKALESVKSLAENKRTAHCFDTYADMVAALKNDGISYETGDTIYIKDANVPDYWICGKDAVSGEYGIYELCLLETEKLDLAHYQKASDEALETNSKTVTQAINEIKRRLDEYERALSGVNA